MSDERLEIKDLISVNDSYIHSSGRRTSPPATLTPHVQSIIRSCDRMLVLPQAVFSFHKEWILPLLDGLYFPTSSS